MTRGFVYADGLRAEDRPDAKDIVQRHAAAGGIDQSSKLVAEPLQLAMATEADSTARRYDLRRLGSDGHEAVLAVSKPPCPLEQCAPIPT